MRPEFPGAERVTEEPASLDGPEDRREREEREVMEAEDEEVMVVEVVEAERPEDEERERELGPASALKVPMPVL